MAQKIKVWDRVKVLAVAQGNSAAYVGKTAIVRNIDKVAGTFFVYIGETNLYPCVATQVEVVAPRA